MPRLFNLFPHHPNVDKIELPLQMIKLPPLFPLHLHVYYKSVWMDGWKNGDGMDSMPHICVNWFIIHMKDLSRQEPRFLPWYRELPPFASTHTAALRIHVPHDLLDLASSCVPYQDQGHVPCKLWGKLCALARTRGP